MRNDVSGTVAFTAPLILCAAVHAQRPATIADMMKITTVIEAQISPDGTQVAYVRSVPNIDEDSHNPDIWLVATAGGDPLQLTNSPKGDQSPRWAPDGRAIAFVSDREGAPQIYVINPRGGEARKLTESGTGVQDFAWSHDGRRIAFRARDPQSDDEKKAKEEDGGVIVVDDEFKMTHLHVIEVASKQSKQITQGEFTVDGFSWSPDDRRIVYSARPTPRIPDAQHSDLYLVPADSGPVVALVERAGADQSPAWSPDGSMIAFLSGDGKVMEIDHPVLSVVEARGGTPRAVGRKIDDVVSSFAWTADSRALHFVSPRGVTIQISRLTVATGEFEPVTTAQRSHYAFTASKDGRRMAVLVQDPKTPPEVYAKEAGRSAMTRLTRTNPQLDELALGDMEVVRWRSRDGMAIEGLLLKPVGFQSGKRYPLLTYVHGGPSGFFSLGFEPQLGAAPIPLQAGPYPLQPFAGEGFAVFMPNPRGSSGYGNTFLRANIKDWGHGDFRDIMTGIDHLVSEGFADPDRLGLMGWSYGGYMTSWAISQTDRFKAASVGAGLPNLYSMHGTTDIPDVLVEYFGDRPWNDEEVYKRSSAMFFAENITTPTLIQHGERDERVQVSQAWELYRALQANGAPAQLVIYPRQGHLLLQPKFQRDAQRRNLTWFRRWVTRGVS